MTTMDINERLQRDSVTGGMGRRDWPAPTQTRVAFTLQRVKLDKGGYDLGGAYWGTGEALFCAWGDPVDGDPHQEQVRIFVRAKHKAEAREKVLAEYPRATIA